MDRFRCGAVIAVLTLSAGCAGPGAGGFAPPTGSPEVHAAWTSCAAAMSGPDARSSSAAALPGVDNGAAALPRLGDDFTPVAAVLCRGGPGVRSGAAPAGEERADDIADLVAALRLPDQSRTADVCPAILITTPWLALLDGQGRWVRPGVPVNACGQPRPEVVDAIRALATTRLRTGPPSRK